MEPKAEYRDRPPEEVEVLDALCERVDDGMTVFELRAAVDSDIDAVEAALADLKDDDLITVERENGSVRVFPHDRVVPDPGAERSDGGSILEELRRRIGL